MIVRSGRLALGAAAALVVVVLAPAAQAEDFLSALFGAFGRPLPYASESNSPGVPESDLQRPRTLYSYSGGSQAYCVRTCDGRYFPISATGNQSRAASCNSFCPASDTRVVYGSNIDDAVTESGKPYSELPNAFRYRSEMSLAAPVTARTRPVSRRSKSKTTRRFVKATSWQVAAG